MTGASQEGLHPSKNLGCAPASEALVLHTTSHGRFDHLSQDAGVHHPGPLVTVHIYLTLVYMLVNVWNNILNRAFSFGKRVIGLVYPRGRRQAASLLHEMQIAKAKHGRLFGSDASGPCFGCRRRERRPQPRQAGPRHKPVRGDAFFGCGEWPEASVPWKPGPSIQAKAPSAASFALSGDYPCSLFSHEVYSLCA